MKARVKANYRWFDVKVAGHEFVKGEFQDVPKAIEASVLDHPFLDVADGKAPVIPPAKKGDLFTVKEGEGTGEENTPVDGDQLTTDQTPTTPAPETPPPAAPKPTAGGKKVKAVLTPEEEEAKKELYNANRKEKRAAEKLAKASDKLDAVAGKVG
jgi:hypothetical protein